jgi:hypothetical protein
LPNIDRQSATQIRCDRKNEQATTKGAPARKNNGENSTVECLPTEEHLCLASWLRKLFARIRGWCVLNAL